MRHNPSAALHLSCWQNGLRFSNWYSIERDNLQYKTVGVLGAKTESANGKHQESHKVFHRFWKGSCKNLSKNKASQRQTFLQCAIEKNWLLKFCDSILCNLANSLCLMCARIHLYAIFTFLWRTKELAITLSLCVGQWTAAPANTCTNVELYRFDRDVFTNRFLFCLSIHGRQILPICFNTFLPEIECDANSNMRMSSSKFDAQDHGLQTGHVRYISVKMSPWQYKNTIAFVLQVLWNQCLEDILTWKNIDAGPRCSQKAHCLRHVNLWAGMSSWKNNQQHRSNFPTSFQVFQMSCLPCVSVLTCT